MVRFFEFVLRVGLAFGALLFGLRALGYWVILQFGEVPPPRSRGIALVVYRSVFWFVILSSVSAYLRERTKGASAVVTKTFYLIGAYGLPSIALFTVVSKGAILVRPVVSQFDVIRRGQRPLKKLKRFIADTAE